MFIYGLMLNPLIITLDKELICIRLRPVSVKMSLFAYAYDVTLVVTPTDDIRTVQNIIRTFESATGAILNKAKYVELPAGKWNKSTDVLGIPYVCEIKILGVTYRDTISKTIRTTWPPIVATIKRVVHVTYLRDLSLYPRNRFAHTYLLSRQWYYVQILTLPLGEPRQNSSLIWLIWIGANCLESRYAPHSGPPSKGASNC